MSAVSEITSAGSGVPYSAPSSKWWIAGSETLRIMIEQAVIPS